MREATLVFLIKGNPVSDILLGYKKAGFAQGKLNGFGGKVEVGETIEHATVRELEEEAGIRVAQHDLTQMAHLTFFFPARPEWDQVVHVFLARRWEGEPAESDEMKPMWHKATEIPFAGMWQDDRTGCRAFWRAKESRRGSLSRTITRRSPRPESKSGRLDSIYSTIVLEPGTGRQQSKEWRNCGPCSFASS